MEAAWSLDIKAVVGALVALVFGLYKLRSGLVSLHIKRMGRLYDLLCRDAWRHSHAGTLQLAAEQAFGTILDDREIRYALERHCPVNVMRDRIKASLVVRWDSTSDRYVDARTFTKIKLGVWITVCEVALPLALVVGIASIISVALAGDFRNAAVLSVETVFIVWGITESLQSNSAGQRLLDPSRYPKALTEPTDTKTSIKNLPKRRKRQAIKLESITQ